MVYAVRRGDNVCAQQGLRSHAAAHPEVPVSLLVARFHGLGFRRLRRALRRHRAAIRSYPEVLGVTEARDSGLRGPSADRPPELDRRMPGAHLGWHAEFKTCTVGDTTQKQVLNRARPILGAHALAEPFGSCDHRFALTRIAAFAIAVISVLLAAAVMIFLARTRVARLARLAHALLVRAAGIQLYSSAS